MNATNKISAEIPLETEESILRAVADVEAMLPMLIGLSTEERRRLVKMGDRYAAFVDTAFVRARQFEDTYLPNPSTLAEFEKDIKLRASMKRILTAWNSLNEKLKDTKLVVDSEAYQGARIFYKSVNTFASEGDPDAQRIHDELSKYHKKKTTPKLEPVVEPENPELN